MSTVFYSFFNLFLSFHYAIIYGSFAWYHPPFNLPFIKHTSHSFQRQAPLFWREKEKLLVCFQQFLDNIKRRRRDLNPRAATNDLLPFQGSPFGQLGYFSKAERVGFEPTRPFGQTVFKTASLWPLRYLSISHRIVSWIVTPLFATVFILSYT